MSRGSLVLVFLLLLVVGGALALANMDISVTPVRVETSVSLDAPAR